jgi:serine/threonine-protein kinase
MYESPTSSPHIAGPADASSSYELRRLLGEGGCGKVYEAWDPTLCRPVAVKRLKQASDPDRAVDMLREARMAAALTHPAFVKVFSVEGDARAPSIVMELVRGCTLASHMQAQPYGPEAALGVALQVAEAMREAHASGMVHGDLKPSNLMREPSGTVRILDFGLARSIDPLATQSALHDDARGTIAYMAPECLLGGKSTPLSDIYALGMILYELSAGQRPFGDLNGFGLAAAQLQSSSSAWPYPPQCKPALVSLIRAMTEKDPARRLPSMEAVCERLRALQTGAAPAPVATRAYRMPKLPPSRHLRAGALLLCLLVAGGVSWTRVPAMQGAAPIIYSEAGAMRAGTAALLAPRRERNLDDAVVQFKRILEHDPDHAGAAAGLSLAYGMRYAGDRRDETWLARADAAAQQALRLDDQLSLAHVAQAWVRDNQGRPDEALRLVGQALKLDPRSQFALRVKTSALIHLRRFDEADQAIGEAARLFPADAWFSDCLGQLRFQQDRYAEAESAFRRSIRIAPESTFAYGNLSQALLRQGRAPEALQVLQEGLQVHPDNRLYGHLGTILFERGDYVGAARAFENAVSSAKGSPNLYLNWANLADTLRWIPGRETASRDAYRQATLLLGPKLEKAPDDSTLLSRMGLYSAKLGERGVAERSTGRALELAAASAQIHFRAAIVFELLGERTRAVAELTSAAALGFPRNLIETEPDLLSLRRDPRYHTTTLIKPR